jgi:hypothetical protein
LKARPVNAAEAETQLKSNPTPTTSFYPLLYQFYATARTSRSVLQSTRPILLPSPPLPSHLCPTCGSWPESVRAFIESFHSSRAFLSLILTTARLLACSTPNHPPRIFRHLPPSTFHLPPPQSTPRTSIAQTPRPPLEGRWWMLEGEDRRASRVFQSPEVRHHFFTSSLLRQPWIGTCSFQHRPAQYERPS